MHLDSIIHIRSRLLKMLLNPKPKWDIQSILKPFHIPTPSLSSACLTAVSHMFMRPLEV